jgi:hypothetical protein
MGKKALTKKFATVKRMISTKDHRMYAFVDAVRRIRKRKRNTIKRGDR